MGRSAPVWRAAIAGFVMALGAPGLSARQALLLRAADELHADPRLADEPWAGLARGSWAEVTADRAPPC